MIHPVQSIRVLIRESTHVVAARRKAQRLAELGGFPEEALGRLALVVTEAATNLLRHAEGGEIVLTAMEDRGRWKVDVAVIDQGPGIPRLAEAFRGGHSTGGGLGHGLGAIRRLSDEFAIFSPPGAGTAIHCGLFGSRQPEAPPGGGGIEVDGICRPKPTETACGDGWAFRPSERGGGLLLLVDGLGHGEQAEEATRRTLELLASQSEDAPESLMERLHEGLESTRGAVAAAALLRPGRSEIRFCGLGNISAFVHSRGQRFGLASLNGTLGQGQIRVQEFTRPWAEGDLFVMHSDGIAPRFELSDYPGLAGRAPGLIAACIYRDHQRISDDASLVIARNLGAQVRRAEVDIRPRAVG